MGEETHSQTQGTALDLEISDHAAIAMASRHINEDEIRNCLMEPDSIYQVGRDNVYVQTLASGKRLKVRRRRIPENPAFIVDVVVPR